MSKSEVRLAGAVGILETRCARLLSRKGLACRWRRGKSDELGEESVGLLAEGRPWQVGLVDPQG
jgi:hypothetical protein